MVRTTIIIVTLALLSACATGPRHIGRYKPKERDYEAGEYDVSFEASAGSLYSDDRVGLYEDDRARRVGDMLLIRIDEQDSAMQSATTKLGKRNETNYGVKELFGLMAAVKRKFPNLDTETLIGTTMKTQFDGAGKTERGEKLNATLPVRVKKVMPNGDLYVEGTSVVMVSNEEHHLYLSGLVRKVDVRADNSVLSSRVADAEIEYVGRGDISDQQRQGWGSRALNRGWPF